MKKTHPPEPQNAPDRQARDQRTQDLEYYLRVLKELDEIGASIARLARQKAKSQAKHALMRKAWLEGGAGGTLH
jgi:hypothetical protein